MTASNVAVAALPIRRKSGSMRFNSLYCSINVFYSLDSNNVLGSFRSIYCSDIFILFAVLKQGAVNIVSLTVHHGIILVNNQLDALFSLYLLFHLSTYFEHSVLIIRRVKLY